MVFVAGDQATYQTLSIFDDESVRIDGGELQWVPVRRRLGIHGFGVNAIRAARKGQTVIEDHVESSGQEETVILAIGGWRDRPYHPLPWEPIYLAQEAMRQGDWAAAAETLDREAGEHRDTAVLQFRLACCHARLGEQELALEELRRAIEIDPKMRERAASAEDLASGACIAAREAARVGRRKGTIGGKSNGRSSSERVR